MKKLFITLLVGPLALCLLSPLALADENQSQPIHWFGGLAWWGQPPFPKVPENSSAPGNSNQSNAVKQNQLPPFTESQTQSQASKSLFYYLFHPIKALASLFPDPATNHPDYPKVPATSDFSNQSYVASQNQVRLPTYAEPQVQSPPSPADNGFPVFRTVKGASVTAPPPQRIPEVNLPRTKMVEPVPQPPVVRMNASEPISEPKPTQEQSIQDQLARMTSAEKSRLNAQTDAAFYAKHPELAGKKIDPVTNPIAAQQWTAERNNILAAKAPRASGPPTQRQTSMTAQNAIPNPQPPPSLPTIPTVPPINAPNRAPAVRPTITVNANSPVPPANTLPIIPTVPPINAPNPAPAVRPTITVNANSPVPPANTLPTIPTVPPINPAKLAQEKEQERQRQAQLALQQQQERERQAKLAQEKEQERQRQAQLALQQQQQRERQAKLAQEKEQERQRQAKLAQQKEQERQRQAKLAQQKEQERKRQAQLAQQKQQERQIKAYNAAVKQWQQQEAYRQWQQQQQQQVMSPEEMFYATHGGRNALTEAAWQAGAYR